MGHGIAVKSTDSAGGNQLAGGQNFFKVEGQYVVLQGDNVAPHGLGLHAGPVMVGGSSWMTLNGVPVVRQGHAASCGHQSTGRPWFTIPD